MDLPLDYIVHDIRIGKDFKGITISGYKRKDVINAFQNSMINNKLEDAIRWCVELHSTGLNNIIWNSIDNIYLKYIHINNPKLFFYILKRKKEYKSIIKRYPKKHEIFSRNNQEIRNLYSELTGILTLTKKNNLFLPKSLPLIKKDSFEKYELKKRMISKSLDSILDFIHNTTSNDVKLALNEIMTNLLYINGTFQNCLFWYLWLEKYQKINKESNQILFENVNISKDEQYYDHWTFILWKIIMSFENKLDKSNIIFLRKLEYNYKVDFKINSITRKKFYFFIVFYIIKHNINWNIPLFQQEHLLIQTNANINTMYYNIINIIESNLSNDAKSLLHKNYNQLYFNLKNKEVKIKKIKNNNLDEEINKVVFTEFPEYYDIQKNKSNRSMLSDNDVIKHAQKVLIDKNKTKRDVIQEKEEEKNKQIKAFSQFIAYKKELNNTDKNNINKNNMNNINKNKSVIDYYNKNNNKYNDEHNNEYNNEHNNKHTNIKIIHNRNIDNNDYNEDEYDIYSHQNEKSKITIIKT